MHGVAEGDFAIGNGGYDVIKAFVVAEIDAAECVSRKDQEAADAESRGFGTGEEERMRRILAHGQLGAGIDSHEEGAVGGLEDLAGNAGNGRGKFGVKGEDFGVIPGGGENGEQQSGEWEKDPQF